MKKHWPQFAAFLIFTLGALRAGAGTIFYVPISPTQSDASSGISTDNGYTSAVDGGNTETDRVINGITLYALAGNGETSTADNCTLNALSGSLANGGGTTKSIQVDGTLKEIASDMTFNNGAGDNSQQEIVLDPESLEAGTTYDLRIYISNGSGQDREVNLAFFGDGQEAVETGFFNEDDARTSAGGFKDPNQAYYINYRYTWDGDSTPGITITQKSGSAPFCLYALTNQVVPSAGAAAATGAAAGEEGAAAGEEAAAEDGEQGLSAGFVNAESDEVGVESDDFYSSDSLNSNGRWVKLDKWGTCWQPTNVQAGWCPYTNGNWKDCDDCGWIFDSPEPWAWACYHYGRWAKVRSGCGWAWVPGKVWGASWVSWRQGRSGSSCETCIGWAPLPPEAGCELGVGISSWVDNTCDIGPDCYTFINIRDFGSDSYSGCGTCILDRGTYINIVEQTTNITNISYDKHVNIYSGGPDYNWCNTEIRKYGGKECEKVHVNRYDDPGKLGGKYAQKQGNQLGLVSPNIKGNKNARQPKVAESLGSDKIDKGWSSAKANNKEKELKNHIAQETRGKTPKNTKGTLPPGVAEMQKKHPGGQAGAGAGQAATQQLGGKGQHPGKGGKKGLGTQTAGGQAGAGLDQHPGGKGKLKGQGQLGAAGAGKAAGGQAGAGLDQHPGKGKLKGQGQLGAAGAGQAAGGGFDQHPGKKGKLKGQAQVGAAGGGQAAGGGLDQQAGGKTKGKGQGKLGGAPGATSKQAAAGGGRHPGQSLKGSKKGQAGLSAQKKEGPQGAKQGAQVQGFQPGKQGQGKGQGVQQGQPQTLEGQAQGGQGQGQGLAGQGGKGKHKQQQQLQQPQGQPQTSGQAAGGGQAGGGKAKHKQQQQAQQLQQSQGQPQTSGQAAGGGQAGGGKAKHKQQQQAQQLQQPQGQPQTSGQAAGGGQAGGGKGKHKQQQQAQQFQQPQGQQQTYAQATGGGQGGGGGGKGKHKQQQQAQQFQQQQAQQQQKQLQQQQAQQQQLQQQQAQQQQRQLQQQQTQQQQLQQQQAQQQQRQLQQQQAQQQQQGGKKGKKHQTPPPY